MYELGIPGLTLMFVVVSVFLLSVNFRSNWHWSVKTSAIVFTGLFWVITYFTIASFTGLPSATDLPSEFIFVWSIEKEPIKGPKGDSGVIYMWVLPNTNDEKNLIPRAYELPYSRELHKKLNAAKIRIGNGERIRGRKKASSERGHRRRNPVPELQFFTNKHTIPQK